MKNKFKKIYNFNYKFLMRNIILLESNPDYSDNTKGVFDELLLRGINDNNRIIWFVNDKNKFSSINLKNVRFISRNKNIFNRICRLYYMIFSKYIIDCNKYIYKINKNQFRIHLTHGTPIKNAKDYCSKVGDIDYLIQVSDFFTEMHSNIFNVDKSKIVSTGFPRNDILLSDKTHKFYPNIEREKTILWFPTYRNHKSGKNSIYKMNINFPYGIPCISDNNDLLNLNEYLKKKNILLLIKLHPAEDSSKISSVDLSNIKLLDDSIFDVDHSCLYNYLGNSDAVITDYSSLYYDYLLTNKPIGLAIPDIEEYKKHVNLVFDDYEKNIAGEYIYNYNDLLKFIDNVASNNDISFNDRMAKKKLYHKYTDANSGKRVVDLLLKEMNKNEKTN